MSEIIEVKQRSKFSSDRIRPKVIPWHGVKMIRTHSFTAASQEIINASAKRDVITVSLIGAPGTGKSELARALAHDIHTRAGIPYNVRIFSKKELLDFKTTIEKLEPVNHILIFDDLSFLKAEYSTKKMDQLKQEFTTIRHFEGRKDVKVICIYNFHYSPGFDKYMRQTNFKFWTSIGESEIDFVLKTMGAKYKSMINKFQKQCDDTISKYCWTVRLNDKETFLYKYQDPFIPTLFARGSDLRPVVTPTRYWLQQGAVCTKCEGSEGNDDVIVDFNEVIQQGETNFTPSHFQAAIKMVAFTEGKNVYGKTMTNAIKWLNKARSNHNLPIDRFLAHYGLDISKTRLRKPDYSSQSNTQSVQASSSDQ